MSKKSKRITLFHLFKDWDEYIPSPRSMRELPEYAAALRTFGQHGRAAYIENVYSTLCNRIEEEVTINA